MMIEDDAPEDPVDPPKRKGKWLPILKKFMTSGAFVAVIGGLFTVIAQLRGIDFAKLKELDKFDDVLEQNEELRKAITDQNNSIRLVLGQNGVLRAENARLKQELEKADLNAKLNSYIIKEVVLPVVLSGSTVADRTEPEQEKSWRERLTESLAPEGAVVRPKNPLDDISDRLNAAVQQEQVVLPPNAGDLFDEDRVQRTADSLELKKKK